MGKIKQHYMLELGRGEYHPIFNSAYLAENIASFVETVVLLIESALMALFLINILSSILGKYFIGVTPAIFMNTASVHFFALFGTQSTVISNLIAFILTVIAYGASHVYFENVKYNLHPRKDETEN